jgi:hypothetical protein
MRTQACCGSKQRIIGHIRKQSVCGLRGRKGTATGRAAGALGVEEGRKRARQRAELGSMRLRRQLRAFRGANAKRARQSDQ